jgi:hypothetical protein
MPSNLETKSVLARILSLCLVILIFSHLPLSAQADKPQSTRLPLVFSKSGGAWLKKSTVLSDLGKRRNCAGKVEVTTLPEKADYTFAIDQGFALKWGWVVARRDGSVAASGRDMGAHHAVDDACTAIAKDWQDHKPDREQQGPPRDR